MLEEVLSSTTSSPAEAALSFISFLEVELAAGGPAAESRFFKLFMLLCDRLYGKLGTKKEDYKYLVGGWLSRHAKWERPNTSLGNSASNPPYGMPRRPGTAPSMANSVRTDPVVKLLGASEVISSSAAEHKLTLIEAFAKEAEHRPNVRYPFPFQALPASTQEAWMALIEAALGLRNGDKMPNENATRLLGSLLRVKPLEQKSLCQFQHTKLQKKENQRPLQLSPMKFHSNAMSPMAPAASSNPPSADAKDQESGPLVSLSMLEFYLFMFLRYPTAAPPAQSSSSKPTTPSPHSPVPVRRAEPYGETVYYQVFQEYVNYYIPNTIPQGHSTLKHLNRPSELFLRITVELWLEGQNQLWTTDKALKAYHDRGAANASDDLNASYDLVKAKYDPPASQVTRCFHKLLARAVTDGALLDMSKDFQSGHGGVDGNALALTPTMTILQLPFYNYIRNAFRYASIHAKYSPFYAALNDWLVWLEPWNTRYDNPAKLQTQRLMNVAGGAVHSRGMSSGGSSVSPSARLTYPKASQRSMYTDAWEPYIASNLYLYVVPLAIFLRRSRELDFSPRDYQRSLNTVRRVFRVFSPEVVAVINRLLKKQGGLMYSSIVSRHEEILGGYAPPKMEKGLLACQNDMQNLLEEIYLQHLQKVNSFDFFDRAIATIENFFGGGAYAGENKELQMVANQAKKIVGFPSEWEVVPPSGRLPESAGGKEISGIQFRGKDGFLTEEGREAVRMGTLKLDPLDVVYIGDMMRCEPQSYEIAALVPILIYVADLLNPLLGLPTSVEQEDNDTSLIQIPRRLNFRFLADYRNLAFFLIFYWCWSLMFRR
eukprot:Nitzschia sp. Nitz4//scaffold182_size44100//27956//30465//NITZ4_007257-RA/size44100-snap-gene-0.9-mRNA-1//-1//CDS//3329539574//3401//frame0